MAGVQQRTGNVNEEREANWDKRNGNSDSARGHGMKATLLSLTNLRIFYWSCTGVKQSLHVLDKLVYSADVVELRVVSLEI